MQHFVIGLTGPMGSGKQELINILETLNYKHVTLSSFVREEAKNRGVEELREKLMEVGNSMRKEHGAGVLAKMAMNKILSSDHFFWIIDGIRNPEEIFEIKKHPKSWIVGVTADRELLISRILSRGRESDPKLREEIETKIDREWGVGEPDDGQQVGKCMDLADVVILNNGTLAQLNESFFELYNKIMNEKN